MANTKTVITSYELVEEGVRLYESINGVTIDWNEMCDMVDDYDDTNKDYDEDMVNDITELYGEKHFKSILFNEMYKVYSDFYLAN